MTYEELIEKRPSLFWKNELLDIIADKEQIEEFEKESGRKIGICYESPYNMVIVDLVQDLSGKKFAYERIVPKKEGKAVACFPVYQDKIVLLDQFRHTMRDYQYAIPRGYGVPGFSGKENAEKEIKEELGAEVLDLTYLKDVVADSGLTGTMVGIYFCRITEPESKKGYEGIKTIKMVTEEEFKRMIRKGDINDGFTLSAYAMVQARDLLYPIQVDYALQR